MGAMQLLGLTTHSGEAEQGLGPKGWWPAGLVWCGGGGLGVCLLLSFQQHTTRWIVDQAALQLLSTAPMS
jgi:hypothetical protein